MSIKKKSGNSFGVIFWIALVAITAIIFISNRSNIETASDGIQRLIGARRAAQQSAADGAPSEQIAEEEGGVGARPSAEDGEEDGQGQNLRIEQALRDLERVHLGNESDNNASVSVKPKATQAESNQDDPVAEEQQRTNTATPATRYLYFIDVDDAGRITPVRVARATEQSRAPMSQAVQLLIAGLVAEEQQNGLLNLLPSGSQLLSAHIKEGVAYLNFNEQFRYNPLGNEGVVAQLTQVVYSVTEFSTIQRVQILIDGQKVDYLNSESRVYLKEPIGRGFI